MKTYRLEELDTDAWVEAISALDDEHLDEAIDAATDEDVLNWARNCRCPAELESEYSAIAKHYGYRFDKNGKIVNIKGGKGK